MKKHLNSKHHSLIEIISKELARQGVWSYISTEKEYALGECDILCGSQALRMYTEIKCNHTKKGYQKAMYQLFRWSSWMKYHHPKIETIGLYIAGYYNHVELVVNNGVLYNPSFVSNSRLRKKFK